MKVMVELLGCTIFLAHTFSSPTPLSAQIKITLLNNRNTKIFYLHKNLNNITIRNILIGLESHQEHNKSHMNYKTWWWLSLANQTQFLQAPTKPKCLQDQPRS